MTAARGYAAPNAHAPLAPFIFARREPGEKDVRIEIAYCGICRSDLHQVRDEWGGAIFPMVPGHEIVGRVTLVGRKVKKFRVGDTAGVGCLVDTCRGCQNCRRGLEQHCLKHPSFTY
ncbi:MAG: alcohol dehydrogenase catalytic domain-containing protein, partial [Elusimicrobiota bacterium]